MEGYITLIEIVGNRWELTVRLPNKFLQQYPSISGPQVCGDALREKWGDLYYEDNVPQPWRCRSRVLCSLGKAEQAAAIVMEEIREAKASLKPRGYVKYTLSLTENGPIVKQEERQGPAENEPF